MQLQLRCKQGARDFRPLAMMMPSRSTPTTFRAAALRCCWRRSGWCLDPCHPPRVRSMRFVSAVPSHSFSWAPWERQRCVHRPSSVVPQVPLPNAMSTGVPVRVPCPLRGGAKREALPLPGGTPRPVPTRGTAHPAVGRCLGPAGTALPGAGLARAPLLGPGWEGTRRHPALCTPSQGRLRRWAPPLPPLA